MANPQVVQTCVTCLGIGDDMRVPTTLSDTKLRSGGLSAKN